MFTPLNHTETDYRKGLGKWGMHRKPESFDFASFVRGPKKYLGA